MCCCNIWENSEVLASCGSDCAWGQAFSSKGKAQWCGWTLCCVYKVFARDN